LPFIWAAAVNAGRWSSINASNPNGIIIMGGNADSARPLLDFSGMHTILLLSGAPLGNLSAPSAGAPLIQINC
jgi:hypothetical protein